MNGNGYGKNVSTRALLPSDLMFSLFDVEHFSTFYVQSFDVGSNSTFSLLNVEYFSTLSTFLLKYFLMLSTFLRSVL
jgi:hypothetical protein